MTIFTTTIKTFAFIWAFNFTLVFVVRPADKHIAKAEHQKEIQKEKLPRERCKGRWRGEAPICELAFFRDAELCK